MVVDINSKKEGTIEEQEKAEEKEIKSDVEKLAMEIASENEVQR